MEKNNSNFKRLILELETNKECMCDTYCMMYNQISHSVKPNWGLAEHVQEVIVKSTGHLTHLAIVIYEYISDKKDFESI